MALIHLIRIPDRDSRVRAISAFLEVGEQYVRLPDNRFGLTEKLVESLKKHHIPFEDLSRPRQNGETPVQS